jgi:hypothetical protein
LIDSNLLIDISWQFIEKMAGAIIENMSGRKLAMIGSVLILCQIICFLVGAIFSPAPNNSDQFLATKVGYRTKISGNGS